MLWVLMSSFCGGSVCAVCGQVCVGWWVLTAIVCHGPPAQDATVAWVNLTSSVCVCVVCVPRCSVCVCVQHHISHFETWKVCSGCSVWLSVGGLCCAVCGQVCCGVVGANPALITCVGLQLQDAHMASANLLLCAVCVWCVSPGVCVCVWA